MSSSPKSNKEDASPKDLAIKYVNALAEVCPKQIQPYVQKAAPVAGNVAELVEKAIPIIQKLHAKALELWKKVEPYRPDLLIPSFIGFIMCFFGGHFLTLIAAVEAYRMCGYETTVECIRSLIDDVQKAYEANKKDDQVDDNNDGIPDVVQVSNKQLVVRKTLLFLKVVDPNKLNMAIAGINAGFLAVLATLKLRFAKTITLGNAIASAIEAPVFHFVLPHIEKVMPQEYRKWAKPTLSYAIRSAAISLAWTLQRIISAFHSAIRGGLMFSRNILVYLSKMNYIHINHEETILDEVIGYGLAVLGLVFQLAFGFGLPFPLSILLFPFTAMEYFLIWSLNTNANA